MAGASEDFLATAGEGTPTSESKARPLRDIVREDIVKHDHPFHTKTDDQLRTIAKSNSRKGVMNPEERKFYDKRKQDAESVLSQRADSKPWWHK
jgi:hypothetical protein